MGTVQAQAIMSLDGYVAKQDNTIGRLFDWLQNGEVAPAMGVLRTATVSAMTPAVVASCDRATFDELLRPLFADDG